ncbi:DUF2332 domain-containing protein [Nonomuraea ceibae]|uniref:DUF2332 domain-containing protein n=1 Tax=Nonomuraea ceibae TaxID=1935170 RepID=UPI001C5E5D08|nr:DUF2332 domain-containing protein [Nonomuraea ceibae]
MDTAGRYRGFALEARGHSPAYELLASRIADDDGLLALIDRLPEAKRQPNLLLGAVRHHGGPHDDYAAFRAWTTAHWDLVSATMRARSTQTNEPGRCATLLPVLAALPQPLALIEVGASAGLCLYPDRYAYRYDDRPVLGSAEVVLDCRTGGRAPLPREVPAVAWRAGLDLNPLDVRDPGDVRWLESLIWPERHERLRRLRAAVRVAGADPPRLVRGDLNEALAGLIAQAPAGATPVVFHSAVLAYLPPEARAAFAGTVRALPGHWISNEAPGVLPLPGTPEPPAGRAVFVLALDGRPLAFAGPHGQSLDWFASEPPPATGPAAR